MVTYAPATSRGSLISRRSFLGTAAAAAVTSLAGRLGAAVAPAERRRNVLFIAVDDLRTELGCYGVKGIHSPNIDRLAARGTAFDRAYCQQAVCSPSRTSLLTGCRPDTTKVYDLVTHFRKHLPDVVTLPQHFKNHGYFTRSVGKIYHPGLDDKPSWSEPSPRVGRPTYVLEENKALVRARPRRWQERSLPHPVARSNATKGPAYECADVPDNTYSDGAIADAAIDMLRQAKDKPFFLAVGFLKPHLPFVAPKKYWDLYRRDEIPLAPNPFPPQGRSQVRPGGLGRAARLRGHPAHRSAHGRPSTDAQARLLCLRQLHGCAGRARAGGARSVWACASKP